jgi:hypothetical protein
MQTINFVINPQRAGWAGSFTGATQGAISFAYQSSFQNVVGY